MSKVLFLNIPSHGHINPTLGLVNELHKQGEEITYFLTMIIVKKLKVQEQFLKAMVNKRISLFLKIRFQENQY